MKGITIKEMADELGIKENTVRQRLFVAKIKPLISEVRYPKSALEAIRNVPGKGRPKKQPEPKPAKLVTEPEPEKPAKKAKK